MRIGKLQSLVLTVLLLAGITSPSFMSISAASDTIVLEQFRWSTSQFPLRVLVDMNDWSTDEYAVAVREALDSWLHSIWNYTGSYGATVLNNIRYTFYMSGINSTGSYDVFITFAPDELYPNTGVVGLTSYSVLGHFPVPPITINITTYQKTAYPLFVKNVAMHEFGHALGLGHASSQSTTNGPELMYYRSIKNRVTYPSTLDVYGLSMLYQGYYGQTVQLPSSTPYVMLTDGSILPPLTTFLEDYFVYLIIAVILLIILASGLILWRASRRRPPEEPVTSLSPPENPEDTVTPPEQQT